MGKLRKMLELTHFFRCNLTCYSLILFVFVVTASCIKSNSGQPTTANNATLSEIFEINNSTEYFFILDKFDVVSEIFDNTTIDVVVASLNQTTEFGNYGKKNDLLRKPNFLEKNSMKSAEKEGLPKIEEEWECGTDEFSKLISESIIDRNCPLVKNQINKCCINHDACYDNQLGQKLCDNNFCECLDIVTAKHPICNKEDGPTFCLLVREFGVDPYIQSSLAAKDKLTKEQAQNITSTKPKMS